LDVDDVSRAPVIHSSTSSLDEEVAQSLYAKREKIYPREVHGIFATMRVTAIVTLLGLFYGVAWVRWDSQQVLLFDLPARQFHVFGLTLFPQDFLYLTALLIIAALSLFFFTALAGRLWCGFACPQTAWTEVFLWIERKIEGDRRKQMKLDKSPLTGSKAFKKGTKHTLWILLSLWTGFTFVGYFTPIVELGAKVTSFDLGPWETFWILFYGFATYGNAGWMREQVCLYMCPYARFKARCSIGTLWSSPTTGCVASPGVLASAASITVQKGWATASIAPCACRCALPVSTSGRVFNTSALPAPRAWMPVIRSWSRWAMTRD
jgi:hypothetical protein